MGGMKLNELVESIKEWNQNATYELIDPSEFCINSEIGMNELGSKIGSSYIEIGPFKEYMDLLDPDFVLEDLIEEEERLNNDNDPEFFNKWEKIKKLRKDAKEFRKSLKGAIRIIKDVNQSRDHIYLNSEDESLKNCYNSVKKYLIEGSYTSRVQVEIKRPDIDTIGDKYLQVILDVIRITIEATHDSMNKMEPLEKGSTDQIQAKTIGDYAEFCAGAIGRVIGSQIASINIPPIDIPEEITKVIETVMGVNARKFAEEQLMKRKSSGS